MKEIIRTAVIFSLMAIGVAVFAQDQSQGYGKVKNMGKHVEKMEKKLGLSESQSAQIRSIIEASKTEIKADIEAIKNADKEDKAAARAELQQDKIAMREKILAVLTPEQRVKAEKMHDLFKENKKEKHGKMRGHKHDDDNDDDISTPKQGQPPSTPQQGGGREKTGSGQGQTKK